MIDFNKNLRNLNEEQLNNYITNLFKNEIAFGSQEIYLMQEEIKRLKRIEWEYYETLKIYREMLEDNTKQVRKEVVQEIKEKLKPKEIFHPEDEFTLDYDFYYKEDVEEILHQIQGETK